MSVLEPIVLGALQGLSEFLPISSSAHLYVVPELLGWRYNGLAYDVALHWGTLLALVLAYGNVWWGLTRDAVAGAPAARAQALDTWLKLAVASVPAAIAGLLLEDLAQTTLRALPLQAFTLFAFGALLWGVDRAAPQRDDADTPGWKACLAMGFAQAVSLVPGVSRSGITMTAGRAMGLTRVAAARFSFLLATPITFGAGLLELRHLPAGVPAGSLAIGVITSAVVGLFAIRGLIRWLGTAGFGAFFAYRAALALVIAVALLARR